ncbi:MAG: TraM recognition domain-containing protein [Nitrospirota bacterium]|nr:TraM recognition domain-containing protein [Nitrospirota bacterium]
MTEYINLPKSQMLWQVVLSSAVMALSSELLPANAWSHLADAEILARVRDWGVVCNLLAFIPVMIVHRVGSYPVSWKDLTAGVVLFVGPPLLAMYLPGPFSLLAMQCSFWTCQPWGWHLWTGTRVPQHRVSDAMVEWAQVRQGTPYDPLDYMDLRKGIFLGLGEDDAPVYVSITEARHHLQALGATRMGKNVGVVLLAAQFAALGECVVCFLPKSDRHMPRVLNFVAERLGQKLTFLDLSQEIPQLNPFLHASPKDKEEGLTQIFDLIEHSDNSDVYKLLERSAARIVARLNAKSLPDLFAQASAIPEVTKAIRLYEALREICELPPVQTAEGVDLERVIAEPGIVCIVGSIRHEPTIRLVQLLVLRVVQIIEQKVDRESPTWTTLFLDEFKYCLCSASLAALGTIADKHATVHLAHQTLGDLKASRGLPADSVVSAVLDNTNTKLLFRVNDHQTAKWIEDLCGTVPTHAESFPMTQQYEGGSWRESSGPLFSANVVKALPPLHAILYGLGVPRIIRFGYLPLGDCPTPIEAPRADPPPNRELI